VDDCPQGRADDLAGAVEVQGADQSSTGFRAWLPASPSPDDAGCRCCTAEHRSDSMEEAPSGATN
jgi:hypothetical protein